MSRKPKAAPVLSPTQEQALAEMARGPLICFSPEDWARNSRAPRFRMATLLSLTVQGYARPNGTTMHLSPAGLEAVMRRGLLPQLAGIRKGSEL